MRQLGCWRYSVGSLTDGDFSVAGWSNLFQVSSFTLQTCCPMAWPETCLLIATKRIASRNVEGIDAEKHKFVLYEVIVV